MKRVINSKRGTNKEVTEPIKKTSKKVKEASVSRAIDPDKEETPKTKG